MILTILHLVFTGATLFLGLSLPVAVLRPAPGPGKPD